MNMMFSCLFGVGYVVLRLSQERLPEASARKLLSPPSSSSARRCCHGLGLILFVTAILYLGIGAIIVFTTPAQRAPAFHPDTIRYMI